MKFTYYGHACFSVETGGKVLLFDPFVSSNDLARDAGVTAGKLAADVILVSHGHFDHVGDAKDIAIRTGAPVVGCYELCSWLAQAGVPEILPLNLGGTVDLVFCRAKFVAAAHSSVLPDGTHGGSAGGFYVSTEAGNFYYSGDTALTMDMDLLDKEPKFAVLPIGGVFTMDVRDAVRAAQMLCVKTVVGVHYNTFPPLAIDAKAATKTFADAGIQLLLPTIGESIEF